MTSLLQYHPFAVSAYFVSSTIITFAVPKEELERFVPEPLTLDLHNDQWAFLTIAMVDTKNLKPKGMPDVFGKDFVLIGYRIFVRYKTSKGKNLRGLYIIKSETNKVFMRLFGNIFTRYHYTTTDIQRTEENDVVKISSKKSRFQITYRKPSDELTPLPGNSVFSSWKEARRFAGPLPFTFEVDAKKREVLLIEGVRQNWEPKPIEVLSGDFDFINSLGLVDIRLSNAFEITDIPYYWKKGRFDKW